MPDTEIISRINSAVALLERRDVAFAQAARASFVNVLRKLRAIEIKVKAIKKQYKGDGDGAYNPIWSAVSTAVSPSGDGQSMTGWYFATGAADTVIVFPKGVTPSPITVMFERPHAANKRYAGVYVDYGEKRAGGMVKVVLTGPYAPEQFGNAEWFALHAADLFEERHSIFVHELTHYFDTMRSLDHVGYVRSNVKGRTAFWNAPDGAPPPDAYLLGNEEVNARFTEFIAACVRLLELNILHAVADYKTLSDDVAASGKTWAEYTGGDRFADPASFLRYRIYGSYIGATATEFVANVPHLFSAQELAYFKETWQLLMQDRASRQRMINRATALYAELIALADAAVQSILKNKRPKVMLKSKSVMVAGRTNGKDVKMKSVRYVHRT